MSRLISFFIIVTALIINASSASAAIAAKASYVEGQAHYVSVVDSNMHRVEIDTPFREGDRVITGSDGKVEIEFDTGARLQVDFDTDVTIKSLKKRDDGALNVVFELVSGMFISSFSKAMGGDVVEYHTKSAITGISGTPSHAVKVDVTPKGVDRTSVYLFGEIDDDGSLFVRGFDPSRTEVTLFPKHGTTVLAGMAPVLPFILTPELIKSLSQRMMSPGGGTPGSSTASSGQAGGATASAAEGIGLGTMAAIGGGVALGAVALSGSGSDGGDGDGSGGDSGAPTDVSGVWNMHLRCAGAGSDASVITLTINESSGGAFSGSGSGTDYSGIAMSHSISGTYDSSSKHMSGVLTTSFTGGSCTREDSFSTTLTSNDSGYIGLSQTRACGCDAEARFVKLN